MAEQVEILRIEVDNESAQKALVTYEQRLVALRAEQKRLRTELVESNGTNKQVAEQLVQVTKQVDQNNKKRKELVKTVNTEANSLQAMRNNLAKAVRIRNQMNISTVEGKKRFDALNKSIKEQNDAIKKAEQAGGDFRRSVGNYGSALDSIPGPIGLVVRGIKSMTMAAKAFIATPLGLIIAGISAAIGALIAYFKSSEEGQAALNKVTKVFSVILGNLSDIVAEVGKAIFNMITNPKQAIIDLGNLIKDNITNRFEAFGKIGRAVAKIFSSDWKEGLQDLGDATIQLGTGVEDFSDKAINAFNSARQGMADLVEETQREIEQAKILADLELATNRMEREQIVATAKVEAEVAELRRKAREENSYSAQERLEFLNQANILQEGLIEKDIKIAENRLELQRITNSFSKSTKENLDAEAQLEKQLFDVQTKRENQRRQILREQNTVYKQANAERIREIKELENAINEEQLFLDEVLSQTVEREKSLNEQLAEVEAARLEQVAIDAQKEIDIQNMKRDLTIAATTQVLSSVAGVMRKGSEAYKAFATAEAIISAYLAITKTLASLPFPANVISAAAIGVQAFAQVKQIQETEVGGGFYTGGRIGNRGVHVQPDKRGDNRLILANDEEVILNSVQQSRIGAQSLKNAGVPGFADGGAVNLAGSVPSDVMQADLISDILMRMPSPIVTVKDINDVPNRVRIKERVSTL